jgi:hypothetical protein
MKTKRIGNFTLSVVIYILSYVHSLHAQIYTGGNMSAGYANGLYLDIAPIIGYRIERYRIGASPVFSYRTQTSGSAYVLSYGARLFNQFDIVEGLFAHAEFQVLNTEYVVNYPDGSMKTRVWSKALPVGAGYQYNISERATFQAMVLYDLLQDKKSIYNKPIIRAGIIYNF